MSKWTDVARFEDFPAGKRVYVPNRPFEVVVINLGGTFYAIENVCTHDGEDLGEGEVEGFEVICPRHGAQFDVRDGRVTMGPALEDLKTFKTRVLDGMVQVEL